MIETQEIRMPAKKMFSVLFLQNGTIGISVAFGGVLIFCILAMIFDPKFFILALIWIFMIVPMYVAFLYFYFGMRPLTAFNCIPHQIVFDEDKLTVKLMPLSPESKAIDPDEIVIEDEKTSEKEIKTYEVTKTEFSGLKYSGDFFILNFGTKGWLWLPSVAFESVEDYKLIMREYIPAMKNDGQG